MVRRVAAGERLDRTRFRTEVERLDHGVQFAAYRCPHCGTGVEFRSWHFDPDGSRATVEQFRRSEFDAARPLAALEAVVEFHGPGCGAPVRIVYAQQGDQDRTFDAELLEVLEVTSEGGPTDPRTHGPKDPRT